MPGGRRDSSFRVLNAKDQDESEGSEEETEDHRSCLQKDLAGLRAVLVKPLNLLLVFFPLGLVAGYQGWGDTTIFWLNFAALVPIAGIMGAATEAVAAHTGDLLGGLLNATFGNAIEMIVTWQALHKAAVGPDLDMIKVVQGSLLGSVLSNLLLVLGTAFLVGGFWFKEQGFNLKGAQSNVSCLLLSSIALMLPTMYSFASEVDEHNVLQASRMSAIVLTSMYVLFLVFQLKTHVHLFTGQDLEEDEEPELSFGGSLAVLALVVVAAVLSSQLLVDALQGMSVEVGVPKTFVGVVLLPIVGNAVEHTTAVTAAAKDKMDLAIGIAVGSSTQIALFVVPFSVLLAWAMDVPMTLDFHVFNAGVMVMSVLIVSAVISDGFSNWLEGAMLVAVYILCSVIFFMTPDPPENSLRLEL